MARKSSFALSLAALVLLVSCGEKGGPTGSSPAGTSPAGSSIVWEKDYTKGMSRAQAEGKPVMLYFTADW